MIQNNFFATIPFLKTITRLSKAALPKRGGFFMKVEREFIGSESLEEIVQSFLEYMIDKMSNASYDKERTNVTPTTKGVAN
jgi:hypothetical protein